MNTRKNPVIDESVMDSAINPLTFSDFKIKVKRSSLPNTWEKHGDMLLPKEIDMEADKVVKVYSTPDSRKFYIGIKLQG